MCELVGPSTHLLSENWSLLKCDRNHRWVKSVLEKGLRLNVLRSSCTCSVEHLMLSENILQQMHRVYRVLIKHLLCYVFGTVSFKHGIRMIHFRIGYLTSSYPNSGVIETGAESVLWTLYLEIINFLKFIFSGFGKTWDRISKNRDRIQRISYQTAIDRLHSSLSWWKHFPSPQIRLWSSYSAFVVQRVLACLNRTVSLILAL